MIFRDDRFRVTGTIPVNVRNGVIKVSNDLDRQNQISIFRRPVILTCGAKVRFRQQGNASGTAAYLNSGVPQFRKCSWQELASNVLVDKQRFRCVTGRRVLNFGVENDPQGFLDVSVAVHIDVTDSFAMSEDRDASVLSHKSDQLAAPSWNDEVHLTVQCQQLLYVGTGLKQLNRIHRYRSKRGKRLAPGRD